MHNLPSLNTDLIILAVFGGCLAYGIVMGQSKVKTLAMSVYVGLVLSQSFGDNAYNLVKQYGLTPDSVKLIVFVAPLVLLELGRHQGSAHRRSGIVMTSILSILTAGLIVSSGLSLLEQGTLRSVLDNSNLASQIYNFKLLWIGLVPLAVIGESFVKMTGLSSSSQPKH